MEFNEADLAAVARIQELKVCTPAKAKEIYRKHVLKLANPDVEGRAQLVLEAIERGVEVNGDEEKAEETVKPTRFERKQAKKAAKAAKQAAKKSNGKKAPKSEPRVEVALPKLEREVELTPIPDFPNLYTANLFGRKHVVNWQEINRTQGVAQRFNAVTMSNKRMDAAAKYAKGNDLPLAFCVTVRVLGKLDQGYAVPAETFHKFEHKQGPNLGFALSGKARQAYEQEGWAGCKFVEKKVSEKAA